MDGERRNIDSISMLISNQRVEMSGTSICCSLETGWTIDWLAQMTESKQVYRAIFEKNRTIIIFSWRETQATN